MEHAAVRCRTKSLLHRSGVSDVPEEQSMLKRSWKQPSKMVSIYYVAEAPMLRWAVRKAVGAEAVPACGCRYPDKARKLG